jgi:hypothetical protein
MRSTTRAARVLAQSLSAATVAAALCAGTAQGVDAGQSSKDAVAMLRAFLDRAGGAPYLGRCSAIC